jgi:hypothetical protein
MLEQIPFWDRAAFLAGLMTVGAVIDYWQQGRAATRYKEYAFIWFTGLIGGLLGGANDLITSSISPQYFILGKGLESGAGFQMRAMVFGIKEGLSAGVIAGAVSVYVARRKSQGPPLHLDSLLYMLWRPIFCPVVGAVIFPLLLGGSDPAGLRSKLVNMDPALLITPPFLRVWWIHTGLYAGLLAGMIWLITSVVTRRKLPTAQA